MAQSSKIPPPYPIADECVCVTEDTGCSVGVSVEPDTQRKTRWPRVCVKGRGEEDSHGFFNPRYGTWELKLASGLMISGGTVASQPASQSVSQSSGNVDYLQRGTEIWRWMGGLRGLNRQVNETNEMVWGLIGTCGYVFPMRGPSFLG